MKRTYSKPVINFDSFELQASIASGCAISAEHTAGSCPVIIAGMPVFLDDVSGCKFKVMDGRDNICYYVPTADNMVFSS